MIEINLDKVNATATVRPTSALTEQDFNELASIIDPFIAEQGKLKGLVILVEKFPGWENFGSFVRHIRFVKDHQKKVKRIAFVADQALLSILPSIATHFVEAEVKHFDLDQLAEAEAWIAA
jgi:hypothetical protein